MTAVAEHFIASLTASQRHARPWRHWLLDDLYPAELTAALEALPFAPPSGVLHEGRREINNSTRVFFDAATQDEHPCCARLVAAMLDRRVLAAIERECAIDLSGSLLRLE